MCMNTSSLKELFFKFLKIALFSFGGGMAMVEVVKSEVVGKFISEEDFYNGLMVAQSLPGTIILNLAMYIGYKAFRLKGLVICLIASLLPPFCIIGLLSSVMINLDKSVLIPKFLIGISVIVPVLILNTGITLMNKLKGNIYEYLSFSIALMLLLLKVSPMIILILCIALTLLKVKFNLKC